MKKMDLIITFLFSIVMIVLALLGFCYLDLWMLMIGAIVILIAFVIMQMTKKNNEEVKEEH